MFRYHHVHRKQESKDLKPQISVSTMSFISCKYQMRIMLAHAIRYSTDVGGEAEVYMNKMR